MIDVALIDTRRDAGLEQFVSRMIELWGFDYIEDLFNQGYEPVITDECKWAFIKA